MPGDWGTSEAQPGDSSALDLGPVPYLPADPAVVGCHGVVTIRIPGGPAPGEVRVRVRGTHELFIAYTEEALNVGNRVVVRRSRGGRAVDVTSIFTEP